MCRQWSRSLERGTDEQAHLVERVPLPGRRPPGSAWPGDVVRQTAAGTVRWRQSGIDPEVDGGREALAGGSGRQDAGHLGFQVAASDTGWPFGIDPILRYATHLGGSGEGAAWGHAIAVDAWPNPHALVTGITQAIDYPTIAWA